MVHIVTLRCEGDMISIYELSGGYRAKVYHAMPIDEEASIYAYGKKKNSYPHMPNRLICLFSGLALLLPSSLA